MKQGAFKGHWKTLLTLGKLVDRVILLLEPPNPWARRHPFSIHGCCSLSMSIQLVCNVQHLRWAKTIPSGTCCPTTQYAEVRGERIARRLGGVRKLNRVSFAMVKKRLDHLIKTQEFLFPQLCGNITFADQVVYNAIAYGPVGSSICYHGRYQSGRHRHNKGSRECTFKIKRKERVRAMLVEDLMERKSSPTYQSNGAHIM